MLGNPGSNPLELFWDVVDTLDQKLDEKIAIVVEAIKAHNAQAAGSVANAEGTEQEQKSEDSGFVIGPETTEEDFMIVIKNQEDTLKKLSAEEVHVVFETVSNLSRTGQVYVN